MPRNKNKIFTHFVSECRQIELFMSYYYYYKKGQQCKAGREWYTPYQSEDPSPTIPTYRQKEKKGKDSRRL